MERLSRNEQLTLYGLVRHPDHTDRELAAELGLKPSTVTSIKNRLKNEGHFETIRIPAFWRLGCELFCVGNFRLNPAAPTEELLKKLREHLGPRGEVALAVTDATQLFIWALCRKYSDAWSVSEDCIQKLADEGIILLEGGTPRLHHFPLEQLELFNMFNASSVLKKLFGLDVKDKDSDCGLNPEMRTRSLNRIEKQVLCGLVQYPELLDSALAKKIGVSRQSVTKIKRRLETEKYIATVRVPNYQKLDLQIMLVGTYILSPSAPASAAKSLMEWVLHEMPPVFQFRCNRNGFGIGLARDYRAVHRTLREICKKYTETGALKKDPDIQIYSLPDVVYIKPLSFLPALKKILDMDEKGKQEGARPNVKKAVKG